LSHRYASESKLTVSQKVRKERLGHCEPFDRLRVNSSKPFGAEPFGPELTAEGQSRNWTDIHEIATALRASQ